MFKLLFFYSIIKIINLCEISNIHITLGNKAKVENHAHYYTIGFHVT